MACRSPEHPSKLLTKRLIGLEGDWVAVPGEVSIHRIEKVRTFIMMRAKIFS